MTPPGSVPPSPTGNVLASSASSSLGARQSLAASPSSTGSSCSPRRTRSSPGASASAGPRSMRSGCACRKEGDKNNRHKQRCEIPESNHESFVSLKSVCEKNESGPARLVAGGGPPLPDENTASMRPVFISGRIIAPYGPSANGGRPVLKQLIQLGLSGAGLTDPLNKGVGG